MIRHKYQRIKTYCQCRGLSQQYRVIGYEMKKVNETHYYPIRDIHTNELFCISPKDFERIQQIARAFEVPLDHLSGLNPEYFVNAHPVSSAEQSASELMYFETVTQMIPIAEIEFLDTPN